MTASFEKLEALQKQTYFESKLQMVPASLKEIYSAIKGQEDTLIARELIVDGRTFIGLEYAPDGTPVSAYTTNKKGQRVALEQPQDEERPLNHATKDLISERLNEVSKNISSTRAEEVASAEPRSSHPVAKKVRRIDPNNLDRIKETTR